MLIDAHCHIPHKKYKEDDKTSEDVISEAKDAGIEKLIIIGTSISENDQVLKIANAHENVYATIGIYPHDDLDLSMGQIYEKLNAQYTAHKNKIVGIGECGIDITEWKGGRSIDAQEELFKLQIGFAIEKDLPIVIHNRNGDHLVLEILKKYSHITNLRGVVHCFTQNLEFAKEMLALNFYISFSAIITYPSASKELLETVVNIPNDRILVETDSPYLPPQTHRGQTNYPKYVKMVAEKVAALRKTSIEDISALTYKNTCKLFNI